MKRFSILLTVMAVIALAFTGCTNPAAGEPGEEGPTGPGGSAAYILDLSTVADHVYSIGGVIFDGTLEESASIYEVPGGNDEWFVPAGAQVVLRGLDDLSPATATGGASVTLFDIIGYELTDIKSTSWAWQGKENVGFRYEQLASVVASGAEAVAGEMDWTFTMPARNATVTILMNYLTSLSLDSTYDNANDTLDLNITWSPATIIMSSGISFVYTIIADDGDGYWETITSGSDTTAGGEVGTTGFDVPQIDTSSLVPGDYTVVVTPMTSLAYIATQLDLEPDVSVSEDNTTEEASVAELLAEITRQEYPYVMTGTFTVE